MVNPAENFREIKMSPEKNDENLKTIYEQYWLHARHVADERLWFTNIYILVVVGILIFFANRSTFVRSLGSYSICFAPFSCWLLNVPFTNSPLHYIFQNRRIDSDK